MVSARLFALDWYQYWRDPSLCISIGWDLWSSIGWDFWIGIISWKLGFLNNRWVSVETFGNETCVSVATFGNETCSLWLSGCFLNGTSKLCNFLDDI
ncbi:hypothetical protein RIR_jg18792.t2 [Rhizophagus irregularis DAOM 181602=DAOM 197198]|nr:hypothetical protein RIR_jg18792.t2 [Rhizophagus irregularis DAOM 181602=DAOM 197198]